MAFELTGNTASETIDEADTLLFDVARILKLTLPLVQRLDDQFYESPTFSLGEAATLWAEFSTLAASLKAEPEAAHHAWAARPNGFRLQIMSHPPDVSKMLAKIEALARVCRYVVINGGTLMGLSD